MKTETRDSKKVGGTIDSWCGKCKLVLAHTIEAMVGEKPARVHCNTCKAQHTYKAHAPVAKVPAASSAAAGTQPAKPRASRYHTLLKGKDTARARAYSSTERYAPGDLLQHAMFGFGVTTAVKDGTKIEVLFEGGLRVLIHDR